MTEPIVMTWQRTTVADLATTWAAFSDTERFNRIAGLDFRFALDPKAGARAESTGQMRHLGLLLRWREQPVRFEAPRHFLIERVFENGPVARSQTELHLEAIPSGTQVLFENRIWPRTELLRAALRLDAEWTLRPRLLHGLDEVLAALDSRAGTPDLAAKGLSAAAERILRAGLPALADDEVATLLAQHLRSAPLAEQIRLRPLQLARQWRLDDKRVTAGLLRAVQAGILDLHWEVICPSCRLPTATPERLGLQGVSQHCGVCDVRYDASLADAVVLTCTPSLNIRSNLGKIDCLSSPARMPHLAGQTVLDPRQERDWTLDLLPGTYTLRGWPQLEQVTVVVRKDVARRQQTVLAGPRALSPPALRLGAGRVTLRIRSKLDEPLTLVLERPWVEPSTLTVGRLLEWPELAELLPADSLEPGVQIQPFVGLTIAVRVHRGGRPAEQAVGDALRTAGARALQVSTGWVLATLSSGAALGRAVAVLANVPWLSAAVGYGAVIELFTADQRMASGALLQELASRAQEAEPGQLLALGLGGWPTPPPECLESYLGPDTTTLLPKGPGSPLPPPVQLGRPVAPGDVVDGRFQLAQQVGLGGFGVVFAATDRLTGASVVVKVLRPELAEDPIQVQRFFDEGRLASRLRDPHVVAVLEWGLAEDGRLFLAMERLEGRELAEVLADLGTLDPVRSLTLCSQALAGLAEAHLQGLVHRDIKPANLFVVHEGTPAECCKVIDFGIALDLTGLVAAPEQAGSLVGTPLYMSPEQVQGAPLDGRCDLYALGIVLYQAIAGGLPFSGDTALSILVARLVQVPRSLQEASAQPVPVGVQALLERVLALQPDDRPSSAADMLLELQDILLSAGEPDGWRLSWQKHRAVASGLSVLSGADTIADTPTARQRLAQAAASPPGPESGFNAVLASTDQSKSSE